MRAAGQPRPGKLWRAQCALANRNEHGARILLAFFGQCRGIMVDVANLFSKAFGHQVRAPIYSFKILNTGQENARKVGQLYAKHCSV